MRPTALQRVEKQIERQRELLRAAQERAQEAGQRVADAPDEQKGQLGRIAGMRRAQLARISAKMERLEAEAAQLRQAPAGRPAGAARGRGRARSPRTAIILAAGGGTKLWPYCETRPKATLPVGNKPAIRRTVDDLRALGVQQIVVVVSHLAQQVRHALGDDVVYVEQAAPGAGTAPALLQAAEVAEGDDLLVVYGDTVSARENFEAVIASYRSTGAEASALLAPLPHEEPGEDWITAWAQDGKLSGVSGHGRHGGTRLTGTYCLRRSALAYVRRNPGVVRHVSVGGMPPLEAELAESIQLMLDDGHQVAAVEAVDYFVDLDRPWHILDANRAAASYLFRHTPKDQVAKGAEISPKAHIEGRLIAEEGAVVGEGTYLSGDVFIGRGSHILRGAMVDRACLGRGVRVHDYCQVHGTLGDHCLVGHGAEFGGVMFERTYLYHYCELAGVIGCSVDIGAATVCGTLRFDDGEGTMEINGRKQRTRHSGASYIGDYCRTGVNVMLMPGSRIGPYSCIGAGAIIYKDVPSRTLLLVKQEHVMKPWGPEQYGW